MVIPRKMALSLMTCLLLVLSAGYSYADSDYGISEDTGGVLDTDGDVADPASDGIADGDITDTDSGVGDTGDTSDIDVENPASDGLADGDITDTETSVGDIGDSGDILDSDNSWDVSWDRDYQWGTSASNLINFITPFAQPGYVLPGLDTMSLLLNINDAMSLNTTKEALADLCINFGPLLSYVLQDTPVNVKSLCQPLLKAVHDDEEVEGVSDVCQAIWDGDGVSGHLEEDGLEDYPDGLEDYPDDLDDGLIGDLPDDLGLDLDETAADGEDIFQARRRKKRSIYTTSSPYKHIPTKRAEPGEQPTDGTYGVDDEYTTDKPYDHFNEFHSDENKGKMQHFVQLLFGMDIHKNTQEKCDDLSSFLVGHKHYTVKDVIAKKMDDMLRYLFHSTPELCHGDKLEESTSTFEPFTRRRRSKRGFFDRFRGDEDDEEVDVEDTTEIVVTEIIVDSTERDGGRRPWWFFGNGDSGEVVTSAPDDGHWFTDEANDDHDHVTPSTGNNTYWSDDEFTHEMIFKLLELLTGVEGQHDICQYMEDINQDPDTTEYIVVQMRNRLMSVTQDYYFCTEVLGIFVGEYNEKRFDICSLMNDAFGSPHSPDVKGSHWDILMLAGFVFDKTLSDAVLDTCEVYGQHGLLTEKERQLCHALKDPTSQDFKKTCRNVFDEHHKHDKKEDVLLEWLKPVLDYPMMHNIMLDIFGDKLEVEGVCKYTADVIYKDLTSMDQLIDSVLDEVLRELARMSPWLCYGRYEEEEEWGTNSPSYEWGTEIPSHDRGTEMPSHERGTKSPSHERGTKSPSHERGTKSPFYEEGTKSPSYEWELITEMPYTRQWVTERWPPREGAPEKDPIAILGAAMTHLGRYENTDTMCEDITNVTAAGEENNADLDDRIDMIKGYLLWAMNDVEMCIDVMDIVTANMNSAHMHDFVGMSSNKQVCESLVYHFNMIYDIEGTEPPSWEVVTKLPFWQHETEPPHREERTTPPLDDKDTVPLRFIQQFISHTSREDFVAKCERFVTPILEQLQGPAWLPDWVDKSDLYYMPSWYKHLGEDFSMVYLPDLINDLYDWGYYPADDTFEMCQTFQDVAYSKHNHDDEEYNFAGMFEKAVRDSIRFLTILSPSTCENKQARNDSKLTTDETPEDEFYTEIPGRLPRHKKNRDEEVEKEFNTEIPGKLSRGSERPWDDEFYTEIPGKMPYGDESPDKDVDIDTFFILDDAFRYLTGYNLCDKDIVEAAQSDKHWGTNDLDIYVDHATENFIKILHDTPYCEGILSEMSEDIGIIFGFEGNQDLCELVYKSFNHPSRIYDIDISIFTSEVDMLHEGKDGIFGTREPPATELPSESEVDMVHGGKDEIFGTREPPATELPSENDPELEFVLAFVTESVKLAGLLYNTSNLHDLMDTSCKVSSSHEEVNVEDILGYRSAEMCNIISDSYLPGYNAEMEMLCNAVHFEKYHREDADDSDKDHDDRPDDDNQDDKDKWSLLNILEWLSQFRPGNCEPMASSHFPEWYPDWFYANGPESIPKWLNYIQQDFSITHLPFMITDLLGYETGNDTREMCTKFTDILNGPPDKHEFADVLVQAASDMVRFLHDISATICPLIEDGIEVPEDLDSFYMASRIIGFFYREGLCGLTWNQDSWNNLDFYTDEAAYLMEGVLYDVSWCEDFLTYISSTDIGGTYGFRDNHEMCQFISDTTSLHFVDDYFEPEDLRLDFLATASGIERQERMESFVRALIKFFGERYGENKGLHNTIVDTCLIFSGSLDIEAFHGPHSQEMCNILYSVTLNNDFIELCVEANEIDDTPECSQWPEWPGNKPGDDDDDHIDDDDDEEEHDDDKDDGDDSKNPWLDGIPTSIEDVYVLLQNLLGFDVSTPEGMCDATASLVYGNTMTTEEWVHQMLDKALDSLMHMAPLLCPEHEENFVTKNPPWYEYFPTDSPFTEEWVTEIWTDSPFSDIEIPALSSLAQVIAHLAEYDSTDALCQDINGKDEDNTLDDHMEKVKYNLLSTLSNVDICTDMLNEVEEEMDMQRVHDLMGVSSNRRLCETMVDQFNHGSVDDINMSFILNGSIPGNVRPMEEIIKFAGCVYHAGSFKDVIKTTCDVFNADSSLCGLLSFIPRPLFVASCQQIISPIYHDMGRFDWLFNWLNAPDDDVNYEKFPEWYPDWFYANDAELIPIWLNHIRRDFSLQYVPGMIHDLLQTGYEPGDDNEQMCRAFNDLMYLDKYRFQDVFNYALQDLVKFLYETSQQVCPLLENPSHDQELPQDIDSFYLASRAIDYFYDGFCDLDYWNDNDWASLGFFTDEAAGLIDGLFTQPSFCEGFLNFMSGASIGEMYGFHSNHDMCLFISDATSQNFYYDYYEEINPDDLRLDFLSTTNQNERQSKMGTFFRTLMIFFGELYANDQPIYDVLSDICQTFSATGDVESFLGPRSEEMCKFINTGTRMTDDFVEFCADTYNNDNDNDNGGTWNWPQWPWNKPDDDNGEDDNEDDTSSPYDYINVLLQLLGVDLPNPEGVCDATASLFYDNTITVEEWINRTLTDALRELAYASPLICYGMEEEGMTGTPLNEEVVTKYPSYEDKTPAAPVKRHRKHWNEYPATDSPFTEQWVTEIWTDSPFSDIDNSVLSNLWTVIAHLGEYDNTDALCEDITGIVEMAHNGHADLDDRIHRVTENLFSTLKDADMCTDLLNVIDEDMQTVYNLAGLSSSKLICEAVVDQFSQESPDIDMSFILNRNVSANVQPMEELMKFAGRLYRAGHFKDVLKTACDVLTHDDTYGVCGLMPAVPRPFFVTSCVQVVSSALTGGLNFDWISNLLNRPIGGGGGGYHRGRGFPNWLPDYFYATGEENIPHWYRYLDKDFSLSYLPDIINDIYDWGYDPKDDTSGMCTAYADIAYEHNQEYRFSETLRRAVMQTFEFFHSISSEVCPSIDSNDNNPDINSFIFIRKVVQELTYVDLCDDYGMFDSSYTEDQFMQMFFDSYRCRTVLNSVQDDIGIKFGFTSNSDMCSFLWYSMNSYNEIDISYFLRDPDNNPHLGEDYMTSLVKELINFIGSVYRNSWSMYDTVTHICEQFVDDFDDSGRDVYLGDGSDQMCAHTYAYINNYDGMVTFCEDVFNNIDEGDTGRGLQWSNLLNWLTNRHSDISLIQLLSSFSNQLGFHRLPMLDHIPFYDALHFLREISKHVKQIQELFDGLSGGGGDHRGRGFPNWLPDYFYATGEENIPHWYRYLDKDFSLSYLPDIINGIYDWGYDPKDDTSGMCTAYADIAYAYNQEYRFSETLRRAVMQTFEFFHSISSEVCSSIDSYDNTPDINSFILVRKIVQELTYVDLCDDYGMFDSSYTEDQFMQMFFDSYRCRTVLNSIQDDIGMKFGFTSNSDMCSFLWYSMRSYNEIDISYFLRDPDNNPHLGEDYMTSLVKELINLIGGVYQNSNGMRGTVTHICAQFAFDNDLGRDVYLGDGSDQMCNLTYADIYNFQETYDRIVAFCEDVFNEIDEGDAGRGLQWSNLLNWLPNMHSDISLIQLLSSLANQLGFHNLPMLDHIPFYDALHFLRDISKHVKQIQEWFDGQSGGGGDISLIQLLSSFSNQLGFHSLPMLDHIPFYDALHFLRDISEHVKQIQNWINIPSGDGGDHRGRGYPDWLPDYFYITGEENIPNWYRYLDKDFSISYLPDIINDLFEWGYNPQEDVNDMCLTYADIPSSWPPVTFEEVLRKALISTFDFFSSISEEVCSLIDFNNDIEDVYSFRLMSLAVEYLTTEDLCFQPHSTFSDVFKSSDAADQFMNIFFDGFYCTRFLNYIDHVDGNIVTTFGFESSTDMCSFLWEAMNLDNSIEFAYFLRDDDNYQNMVENVTVSLIKELIKLTGDMYHNSLNLYGTVAHVCDLVPTYDYEIDAYLGVHAREMCDNSIYNYDNMFDFCKDVFSNIDNGSESLWSGLLHQIMSIFDISSSKDMCEATATVLYDVEISVEQLVDVILDESLQELARLSPWLCYGRYEDGWEGTKPPFDWDMVTKLPLPWVTENLPTDGPRLEIDDPFDVLVSVIAYLGKYDNSDSMCEDVANVISEREKNNTYIDEHIDMIKTQLYSAMRDVDMCVDLINVVENELHMSISSGRYLCEMITTINHEDLKSVFPEMFSSAAYLMSSLPRKDFVDGCEQIIESRVDVFAGGEFMRHSLIWLGNTVAKQWFNVDFEMPSILNTIFRISNLWSNIGNIDNIFEMPSAVNNIFNRIFRMSNQWSNIGNIDTIFKILSRVPSSDIVCNAATSIIYNDTATTEEQIDHILKAILKELVNMSPSFCYDLIMTDNDNYQTEGTKPPFQEPVPTHSERDLGTERPITEQWDHGEDTHFMSDYVEMIQMIFTYLGEYDSPDMMCTDLTQTVFNGGTEELDQIINRIKNNILTAVMAVGDVDMCADMMDSEYIDIQMMQQLTGMDNGSQICDEIAALFNYNIDTGLAEHFQTARHFMSRIPPQLFHAGCTRPISSINISDIPIQSILVLLNDRLAMGLSDPSAEGVCDAVSSGLSKAVEVVDQKINDTHQQINHGMNNLSSILCSNHNVSVLRILRPMLAQLGNFSSSESMCLELQTMPNGHLIKNATENFNKTLTALHQITQNVDSCAAFLNNIETEASMNLHSYLGMESNQDLCEVAISVIQSTNSSDVAASLLANSLTKKADQYMDMVGDMIGELVDNAMDETFNQFMRLSPILCYEFGFDVPPLDSLQIGILAGLQNWLPIDMIEELKSMVESFADGLNMIDTSYLFKFMNIAQRLMDMTSNMDKDWDMVTELPFTQKWPSDGDRSPVMLDALSTYVMNALHIVMEEFDKDYNDEMVTDGPYEWVTEKWNEHVTGRWTDELEHSVWNMLHPHMKYLLRMIIEYSDAQKWNHDEHLMTDSPFTEWVTDKVREKEDPLIWQYLSREFTDLLRRGYRALDDMNKNDEYTTELPFTMFTERIPEMLPDFNDIWRYYVHPQIMNGLLEFMDRLERNDGRNGRESVTMFPYDDLFTAKWSEEGGPLETIRSVIQAIEQYQNMSLLCQDIANITRPDSDHDHMDNLLNQAKLVAATMINEFSGDVVDYGFDVAVLTHSVAVEVHNVASLITSQVKQMGTEAVIHVERLFTMVGTLYGTMENVTNLQTAAYYACDMLGFNQYGSCGLISVISPEIVESICVETLSPILDPDHRGRNFTEFKPLDVIMFILNSTDFNYTSPYSVCNTTTSILFNENLTGASLVKYIVEQFLHGIANNSVWLCNMPTVTEDANLAEVTGAIEAAFAYLGHFESTDLMCGNVSEMAAISSLLGGNHDLDTLINVVTTNLLHVVNDGEACMELVQSIEGHSSSMAISQLAGFESSDTMCQALVYAFQTTQSSGIVQQATTTNEGEEVNLIIEVVGMLGGIYQAENMEAILATTCKTIATGSGRFQQAAPVCNALSHISYLSPQEFAHFCVVSLAPLYNETVNEDLIPDFTGGDEEEEEDESCLFCNPAVQTIFSEVLGLMNARFGLNNIRNGYDVCYASVEFLTTEHDQVTDFFQESAVLIVESILQQFYLPLICFDQEQDYAATLLEFTAAMLADAESLPNGTVCEVLNNAIESDDTESFRSISSHIASSVFEMMQTVDSCIVFADVVTPPAVNFTHYTGFSSHQAFCEHIATTISGDVGYEVFESNFTTIASTGNVVSSISVKTIISVLGLVYTSDKTGIETLGDVCTQYEGVISADDTAAGASLTSMCDAINQQDLYYISTSCRQLLVPIFLHGNEHPVSLRDLDIAREFLNVLLPLMNYPVWEDQDVVCPATEALLNNANYSMGKIANEVLQHWLTVGIEMTAEICSDWDNVYEYLKPTGYNESIVVAYQYNTRLNNTWLAVANLFGFSSATEMCSAANTAIESRNDGGVDEARSALTERLYSMSSDAATCAEGLASVVALLAAQGVNFDGNNPVYLYTGYLSPQAFCLDFIDAMNGVEQSEDTVCLGIEDCAGVCNGLTTFSCDGQCGGSAAVDCAGVCQGDAVYNDCGYCVLGITGRDSDFGQDKCGTCWSTPDYRQTWDCHGTCDGTAYYDDCGVCVDGETGRLWNVSASRIDCRGVCDGGWVADACGYCEPAYLNFNVEPETQSRYMDCNGDCFVPGSSTFAYENYCGVCVSGETGLDEDEGINACGECIGDDETNEILSCAGCDGVPYSGLVYDACNICGGDGTECFGVAWVEPALTQENVLVSYTAYGAGFTADSTFLCIFIGEAGSETAIAATWQSMLSLTCEVELTQGTYTVQISKDGLAGTDIVATLTVLGTVNLVEMSPTDITLYASDSTFTVTLTADSEEAFENVGGTPYAIVEGVSSSWSQIYEGHYGSDNMTMVFTAPLPAASAQFTVKPSYDGVNVLSTPDDAGFTMTFWAPAPNITEVTFAANGASLVASFDSGVEYRTFTDASCTDVFQSTESLGAGARCMWRGPKTLYIIIGSGENLINVDDTLELRNDSITAFQQDYSHSSTGSAVVQAPDQAVKVSAILVGTEKITSCGTVRLSGRLSKGGAGRDMTFTWSVSTDDASDENIQTVLDDLSSSSSDVTIDGSLLESDTTYTFTMQAANFLGGSDSDTIEVVRSSVAAPEVEIVPKGVDVSQAFVSESFSLGAKVTFYADCVAAGQTQFSWSVDNDQVALNLKTAQTSTLYVDSNSLPGDANVTFTVTVFKSEEPEKNVTQSITVTTVYSDLIAIIRGGKQLTVGRDSGEISIDGSASFDPDDEALDMTYSWQCEQVTDSTACWSFKEGEAGTTFPNDTEGSQSIMYFDALSMQADKTYLLTLVVSKGTRSASTSVNVVALEGDPPRVVIAPVDTVRSDESLSLTATIYHKTELTSVTWETVDTDQGYGFLDLSDEDNLESAVATFGIDFADSSISFLNIKSGKLTAGSSYVFQLTVTGSDGQYGLAKLQVDVLVEITSCSFSLNGLTEYTELETVTFVTENCAADESAYPLSYQIFIGRDDQGTLEAVSQRQSEPTSTGVGKPARTGSTNTTYVVEVCDKYLSCAQFGTTVDVNVKEAFSADEVDELVDDLVTQEKYKLNYMNALVNFNVITQKVGDVNSTSDGSSRRRKRAVTETSDTALEQLTLMQDVIDSTVLDTSTAQLQIDQAQFIVLDDLTTSDQSNFLDVLTTLVGVYESDDDESIPGTSADIILSVTGDLRSGLDTTNHASLIDKISSIESSLTNSQVSNLLLGGDPVETVSGTKTSSVRRAIPSGSYYAKESGSNAAKVDFGTELESRFGANWACSSGSCSGVTIQFEQYESDVDYLSQTSDDQANRAGDIVAISLLDPDSGDELSVSDLSSAITIAMTVTLPQSGKDYECRYWNDTSSEWASDGLITIEVSSTEIECNTTHLTSFTLTAVDSPSTEAVSTEANTEATDTDTDSGSTDAVTTIIPTEQEEIAVDNNDDNTVIIVVVVVVVVVVLAVGAVLGVFIYKMKNKSKRVSPTPEPEDPGTYRSATPHSASQAGASSPWQPKPETPRLEVADVETPISQISPTPMTAQAETQRTESPVQQKETEDQQEENLPNVVTIPVAMATAPLVVPDETKQSSEYTSVLDSNEPLPDPVVYLPPPTATTTGISDGGVANSDGGIADVE